MYLYGRHDRTRYKGKGPPDRLRFIIKILHGNIGLVHLLSTSKNLLPKGILFYLLEENILLRVESKLTGPLMHTLYFYLVRIYTTPYKESGNSILYLLLCKIGKLGVVKKIEQI